MKTLAGILFGFWLGFGSYVYLDKESYTEQLEYMPADTIIEYAKKYDYKLFDDLGKERCMEYWQLGDSTYDYICDTVTTTGE